MQLALAEAREAAMAGEVPVGAVVVRDGRVIARGHNAPISGHDPTAHAEIVALRAAAAALGNYRLDGCTLYVTLEPCTMCSGAILHARLDAVVYGAADARTGAAGSVLDVFADGRINHRITVRGGVLADHCATLLRTFFAGRRQQQRAVAEPLRDDALRPPDTAFASWPALPGAVFQRSDLPGFDGLRMVWTAAAPAPNAATDAVAWLCLHGAAGSSTGFAAVAHALAAAGERVVVPDLIGFGRSDKPKREAVHTPERHRSWLRAWADAVLPPRIILVVRPADDALADALVPALADRIVGRWCLPSRAPQPEDAAAYPDRGHAAGPRAVARWPVAAVGDLQAWSVLLAPVGDDAPALDAQVRHAVEYFRA